MDFPYQKKIALCVYIFTLGFECLMFGNQNEVASILSYTSIWQQLSFNPVSMLNLFAINPSCLVSHFQFFHLWAFKQQF